MDSVWGLAFACHIASRLAYVAGVGAALTAQERRQYFTRTNGIEAGFRRFRRTAQLLMFSDAVSFILLCVATRQTFDPWPRPGVTVVAGVLLIFVGVGTKLWAASTVGRDAYYWRDFFGNAPPAPLDRPGPYRFIRDPMYTLGNLHMYGLALVVASMPGLLASAFDQAALLVFNRLVEKPHFQRLTGRA